MAFALANLILAEGGSGAQNPPPKIDQILYWNDAKMMQGFATIWATERGEPFTGRFRL